MKKKSKIVKSKNNESKTNKDFFYTKEQVMIHKLKKNESWGVSLVTGKYFLVKKTI